MMRNTRSPLQQINPSQAVLKRCKHARSHDGNDLSARSTDYPNAIQANCFMPYQAICLLDAIQVDELPSILVFR